MRCRHRRNFAGGGDVMRGGVSSAWGVVGGHHRRVLSPNFLGPHAPYSRTSPPSITIYLTHS